jgi:hypothetical protein
MKSAPILSEDRVSFESHTHTRKWLTELGSAGSSEALQYGSQLHSGSHVASNLELALHKGLLRVQLAAHQLLEHVLRHRQSHVGLATKENVSNVLWSSLFAITLPDEPLVTLPEPFLRSSVHVSLPTFPAQQA